MCYRLEKQYTLSREQWEEDVIDLWALHEEMTEEEAVMEYLKIAQTLDTYGVQYFEIYNGRQRDLRVVQNLGMLGLSSDESHRNVREQHLWLGVHASGLRIYKRVNK